MSTWINSWETFEINSEKPVNPIHIGGKQSGRFSAIQQLIILEDAHEKHFRMTEAFLCKYLHYYYYRTSCAQVQELL